MRVVDVDEVLRVFGSTRRAARAAYVRQLKGAIAKEWIGEAPGGLPWWRFGQPAKDEDEDPETAVRERRAREEAGVDWRPAIGAEDFVARGAEWLGVDMEELRSNRRGGEVVRARELLVVLGVERYRLKVKDLARVLLKTPDGVTQLNARGARRRNADAGFLAGLQRLDRELAAPAE